MKIDVSIGEVFDKITILQIKLERIKDQEKLKHITHELDVLKSVLQDSSIDMSNDFFKKLRSINETLWDTEDIIREKEEKEEFDVEFIKHARLDAKLNDQRFLIKNEINMFFGSQIKEQKSYEKLY
tara:strand:+ start:117 stop:494 length:378 start_codon:yes stop_codon:yes gene_type:complete